MSHGSFFSSLLSPRRRIDQALHAVIMQAYVEGVSTRSVDVLSRRWDRFGDLQFAGFADLRQVGRRGRRVPQPLTRPHRVPLRLSRRHLRAGHRLGTGSPTTRPAGQPRHRHVGHASTSPAPEEASTWTSRHDRAGRICQLGSGTKQPSDLESCGPRTWNADVIGSGKRSPTLAGCMLR